MPKALKRLINEAFVVERVATRGIALTVKAFCSTCVSGSFLVHEEDGSIVGCVTFKRKKPLLSRSLERRRRRCREREFGRKLVVAAEELQIGKVASRWICGSSVREVKLCRSFLRTTGYSVTGTSRCRILWC